MCINFEVTTEIAVYMHSKPVFYKHLITLASQLRCSWQNCLKYTFIIMHLLGLEFMSTKQLNILGSLQHDKTMLQNSTTDYDSG